MIQVTLDVSILTKKPAKTLCQLAVTFAGCSWKADTDLPDGWNGTEFHPWKWDGPTHLRVFFVNEADIIVGEYVDVPITPFDPKGFENHLARLKEEYSKSLQARIYKDSILQKHEVKWAIADKVVTLIDKPIEESIADAKNTGFLTASVAQFAQKLPPLNRGLNLVFFAEKKEFDPTPGGPSAVGIVAFPIAAEGKWQPEANYPAIRTGSPIGYTYKTNGGAKMTAYCEVTKWPSKQDDRHPIKLRDLEGNFDGHVELSVNDIEDWVPGFLSRIGNLFDYPVLFSAYLEKNKNQLEWNGTTDFEQHKKLIGSLGDFLFAVLRDTLNTGYREIASGDSLVRLAIRQWCDEKFGEEHTLPEDGKINYWRAYATEYDTLKKALSKEESETSLANWKTTLQTIELDEDNKQNFKEIIAGLSFIREQYDGKPDTINEEIEHWLDRWKTFISLLTDNALVAAIISKEWAQASIEAKWQPIIKKVLAQAVYEIRLQQKEVLSNYYKEKIFELVDGSADEINTIRSNSVEAVKNYLDDRIKTNPLQFMPKPSDPFIGTAVPILLTWKGFLDFAVEFLKIQMEQESGKLFPDEKKTYDIPPALRVTVDAYGAKKMSEDDLNDEISGHIVLMQRSKAPRETVYDKEWRCLNRVVIDEPSSAADPFYFVPAFLPETSGIKTPYLAINNEKLSLIAGHQTYHDANHGDADELADANTQHYYFDERHKAYALWYGHNYRFAGFTALNSGVLPSPLRAKDSEWNIPANRFMPDTPFKFKEHAHFRRVPVSKMRIEPKYKGRDVQPTPKGLLPLAFELDDWKGHKKNYVDKTDKETATHYLLADGSRYMQEEIVLHMHKPTTSFWNWYAWLGSDAGTNKPGGTKTYAQLALEMELEARDASLAGNAIKKQVKLCDPAIHQLVTVIIERKFPTTASVNVKELIIDMGTTELLSDPEKQLKIALGTATNVDAAKGTITIAAGEIVRIKIHAQIRKSYFDISSREQKFYDWMTEQLIAKNNSGAYEERGDFYLGLPVDIWFEAAKKPEFSSETLWRNLMPCQLGDKMQLNIIRRPDNYKEFAYASRLEIKHQLWNWNGRLDESNQFLTKDDKLDPEDGKTTAAMKWEAWSFSDRPDLSALVQETNLLATRLESADAKTVEQVLFTDSRPGEEKALYYRFTATAYSRYELLGTKYIATIDSKIEVDKDTRLNKAGTENFWRRYLRKCSKTKRLPKPSIRFALPLTRSISECARDGEINLSEVLVVLNDRWFSEGGLAEQLEVGIDLVSDTSESLEYLNAGNDPILTGTGLGQVTRTESKPDTYPRVDRSGKQPVMIFEPHGPVGLTFDFAAQTPRLKGAAFTISLKNIENFISPSGPNMVNRLQPWSMAQVAVRRALRTKLCEPRMNVEALYSEWTAKEWIQFLPALDSLIPVAWRKAVSARNEISVFYKKTDKSIVIPGTSFPRFNDIITPASHHFFLVLTEKVYDIGGQPCENYLATYFIEQSAGAAHFSLNDGDADNFFKGQEGYMRIMMVTSEEITTADSRERWKQNIWERLFGESGKRNIEEKDLPEFTTIQNDATAAMPMISERIPYKIEDIE